jgi:hypothetical protein
MIETEKYYSDWRGPALARLRADRDLTLMVFGTPCLVKAVPYTDPANGGKCVRIEFWRDMETTPRRTGHTLFTESEPGGKFKYGPAN